MIRQYELIERIRAYDPDADEPLINRAYVYAMIQHGNQVRASGDPYFSHPLEVAGLLADIRLDSASIITALLHDTVEDTDATLADIRRMFGSEVARLVDGVTKLSEIESRSAHTRQAENLRKLVLAMSQDIRVLLVKLADRLHNMRTLHFISGEEKKRRIAAETLDIYVPLAERIGMRDWKEELEDRAFAVLQPDARANIAQRLELLDREGGGQVDSLIEALTQALERAGLEAEVTGRRKRPHSIWTKMQRKDVSLEQVSDIMAFRVVVASAMRCYEALGHLHAAFRAVPERFKDYISNPKENGYRSLHTVLIGPDGHRIEVQIRSGEMHAFAENGAAAHWLYKQEGGGKDGRQYKWVQQFLDILENASSPEEFLSHTKMQLFPDQVFCFTPKGDLKALPAGATLVDFAYAIHSEVGDRCVGGRVNGRQMPLRTELNNGDRVEIATANSLRVTPEWDRFVVTGKARAHIRRHARLRRREEFVKLGRQLLDTEMRDAGHIWRERQLAPVAVGRELDTPEDLLAAIGDGRIAAREVVRALYPEEPPDADTETVVSIERARRRRGERPGPLLIRGLIPGLATHFARCCHPIPGDRIVGIITTGKGVTVHTDECLTLESFSHTPERWIELDWEDEPEQERPGHVGRMRLTAANKPGTLAHVASLIAGNQANISNLKFVNRQPDFFDMLIDVEVNDTRHLNDIMAALSARPEIASVKRAKR